MPTEKNPDRKIVKAIYLLLEKYHRIYGLEVYSFSHGSFGPGYFGFQIAAHRCWWGKDLRNANYQARHGSKGMYGPLVGYWYMASIPSWAAGDQLSLRNWEKLRTTEIVAWFEESLGLRSLFAENARAIAEWRSRYSVEESEKYLLMMNLAGLLASQNGAFPVTPTQTFSEYDPDAKAKAAAILRKLGLSIEEEPGRVFGLDKTFIARNGMALAGDTVFDLWEAHLAGASHDELLKRLRKDG